MNRVISLWRVVILVHIIAWSAANYFGLTQRSTEAHLLTLLGTWVLLTIFLVDLAMIGRHIGGSLIRSRWYRTDQGPSVRVAPLSFLTHFLFGTLLAWRHGDTWGAVSSWSSDLEKEVLECGNLLERAEMELPEAAPRVRQLLTRWRFKEVRETFRRAEAEKQRRQKRYDSLIQMAATSHCVGIIAGLLLEGKDAEAEKTITAARYLLASAHELGLLDQVAGLLEADNMEEAARLIGEARLVQKRGVELARWETRVSNAPAEFRSVLLPLFERLKAADHGTRPYRMALHDLETELLRAEARPRRSAPRA